MNGINSLKKTLTAAPIFKDEKYEKYRVFFVPALILIFAILIVVLVTIPQFFKFLDTQKTIAEFKQKEVFYNEKTSELERIDLNAYRKDLDTSLVALPVDKDIPGALGEILVSLGGSGMSLEGVSFSNSPPESDKVQEYSIILDVGGPISGLMNFLERVTLAPRLIKLTSIEVHKSIGSNINATLSFAAFYQLLPNSIGATDDPLPKISADDTQLLSDIETKIGSVPKTDKVQESSTSGVGKLDPFQP